MAFVQTLASRKLVNTLAITLPASVPWLLVAIALGISFALALAWVWLVTHWRVSTREGLLQQILSVCSLPGAFFLFSLVFLFLFRLGAVLWELPQTGLIRRVESLADGASFLSFLWVLFAASEVTRRWCLTRTEGGSTSFRVLLAVGAYTLRYAVLVLGAFFAIEAFVHHPFWRPFLEKIGGIGVIVLAAYAGIRAIDKTAALVRKRYPLEREEDPTARRIHTQLQFFERVGVGAVLFLAIVSILMLFEPLRKVGWSILASAGAAGLVVGWAAQRTVANLFAGFQIAWTQPIRINDVVVVEGEQGRVEEITLTYVVIRLWDERRLILPLSQFVDKPFQNWSRNSGHLLGTVFLYADYTVPVEAIREELLRILQHHPLWDGRMAKVEVTDVKDWGMEIRILLSASSPDKLWDLRCDVRQRLLRFLQDRFPSSLPRYRALLASGAEGIARWLEPKEDTSKP
ncbi:mechanosensitive ion channel family protein [Candidatus Methylacidithermus pantelleriae]|uniref:Uncharacterized protein n=1 Tax=Candidatus Methylacidithermus pantelleriae TaxID=2744239 RepID=A0A8J2BNT7_9BACT|nr:mechanosensitive ion channel domain-containing protein [Candidatus Methylacidithermus pantelleriae]CAF0694729.1 membrane hypothetical protein [Candidatus Methylacidithermus pantelleriae]